VVADVKNWLQSMFTDWIGLG